MGLGAAHHDVSGGTVVTCGGVCTYGGDKDWTPAGAFMAGIDLRFDRQAPVSIKDDGAGATQPGPPMLDLGYRFLTSAMHMPATSSAWQPRHLVLASRT